jgi:soluble lytic murein transglycosylase-like protein
MLFTKQELAHLAIDAALKAEVPPALVCAIIEVSSGWDAAMQEWQPEPWLLALHPNDFAGGEQEYQALGTRWGLMQFHGARLRDFQYPGKISASELLEPKTNLAAGCYLLGRIMANHHNLLGVLLKWYGFERKDLGKITLQMLPDFERFVAARPAQTSLAG